MRFTLLFQCALELQCKLIAVTDSEPSPTTRTELLAKKVNG